MMVRKEYKYRMLWLFPCLVAMLMLMVVLSPPAAAMSERPVAQKSFASLPEAVDALIAALQGGNDNQLLAVLGPGSENFTYSGDRVADQNGRAHFLKAYKEKNSIEQESAERAVLLVGDKGYPFSFPLVRQKDAWLFDTKAGMEEILNRRIGRNELHTIEVMHAYTDAQREYACRARNDGGGPQFAQYFTSSEGKKDGLYWQASENDAESPFGPLIARATEEGYAGGLDEDPPEAFHGYYFKILKVQGEHANGGTFDYVADGKMVLGFALVAYPAKYGVSGIMTFIVNQEGVIYEKDLGADTPKAAAMAIFDPDETWSKYEEEAAEQWQF
ncbi:MAG: DUF2950 domain-containing protein [Thermodesulfobacteriota bacterium]